MPVSAGRIILESAVPQDMRSLLPDTIDKKSLGPFLQTLAEKHPADYAKVLQHLVDISGRVATERGREMSVGLTDLRTPPKLKAAQLALRKQVHEISQSPTYSSAEKNKRIVELVQSQIDSLRKLGVEEGSSMGQSLAISAKHGFRGDAHQLSQVLVGDLLLADSKGRTIPVPGLHGYAEGVTPDEYWAGAYGTRTGFAAVQLATAKSGYLARQQALAAHRQVVTGDDCGATGTGLEVKGGDKDNVGTVLSTDVGDLKAGTIITRSMLPSLSGKDIIVRSVTTCQMPEGICKICAGKREQGRFPSVGDHIGIHSQRVLSEPLTQMGLRLKHVGGAVGTSDKDIEGFDSLNRLFQVPERYIGASVLAPADGIVGKIEVAPQGGYYVGFKDQRLYVEPGRKITVKPGDNVEAGDTLTDGVPNPSEIGTYKGIGEGRKYFVNKLSEMLNINGIPTHRRNVEVAARAMFDRVRITDPDGVSGFYPGDEVSYSDLAKGYLPRQGAIRAAPDKAVNKYLEKPVMHFSIGTRLTPSVIGSMKKFGVSDILIHDKAPGFEADVQRLTDLTSTDPDWKTRLGGWRVKQTLIDTAQVGGYSDANSTSYIPKAMNPSLL